MYYLYDPITDGYMKRNGSTSNTTNNLFEAKVYRKNLYAAKETGGLLNVGRNLPRGVTAPNKHYQQLPNWVIHEIDLSGNITGIHACPPSYIYV